MSNSFTKMTNVRLECEVKTDRLGNFSKDYKEKAGIDPDLAAVHTVDDKWGTELRVYFDGDDAADELGSQGYHVENRATGFGSERQYRINNNDLFWEMVNAGFKLGNN